MVTMIIEAAFILLVASVAFMAGRDNGLEAAALRAINAAASKVGETPMNDSSKKVKDHIAYLKTLPPDTVLVCTMTAAQWLAWFEKAYVPSVEELLQP